MLLKRSPQPPGDAVRAVDLFPQQKRLLLGGLHQLVAGVELHGQAAGLFLCRGAPFLQARNLLLLPGDARLEIGDHALLAGDSVVGRLGGQGQQQKGQQQGQQEVFHGSAVALSCSSLRVISSASNPLSSALRQ